MSKRTKDTETVCKLGRIYAVMLVYFEKNITPKTALQLIKEELL